MSLFRLRQKVRDEARSSEQRRRRRDLGRACRLGLESLEMRLAPATSIWDGSASNLWSNDDNWDTPPAPGSDLVFPAGAQNTTNVNDLSTINSFASIRFDDAGYNISGAAITLTGSQTGSLAVTNGTGTDQVSLPITFSSTGVVNVAQSTTTLVLGGVLSGGSGLTKQGTGTLQLTANNNYTGTTTVSGGILRVDGNQPGSPISLAAGTTLRGGGTVGAISSFGATVNPGDGPATAILTDSGTFSLDAASTFSVTLNGTTPGAGHSQLAVSDQVTLGGATLATTLGGGFTPTANEQFVIINNTGNPGVVGTFANLPEGGEFISGGQSFQITYVGGDGNDVVLTHLLATTTTVDASPATSVFGQSVTLTANVSPVGGGGPATGSVQFFTGSTSLGTAPLNNGTANLPTTGLHIGPNQVIAKYLGDNVFAMSTSSESLATVNQASTTTTVSPAPNPSVFGQSVTLSATVAAAAPGSGTPTGTVQFFNGANSLGSGTLSGGIATLQTTTLPTGGDSITAVYQGDANFTTSTSAPVTQTVNQASTTTTVTAAPNPSSFGSAVTLTATVAAVSPGSGTATGTVEFFDGSTSLGTGTLSGGVATLSTSTLAMGARSVTAHYQGDTNFAASTSQPLTVNVNQATTTTVTANKTSINFGESVELTATVAPSSGSGTPAGNVTFFTGTTPIGNAALVNGVAKLTKTDLPGGANSITAQYNAQNPFGGSTSQPVTVTVAKANTTSTLKADPNPANLNQVVTLTLTVTSTAASSLKPSGTVTFFNGNVSLGTSILNAQGVATLQTSALGLGTHSVTAQFPGDNNYNASTSPAITVTIKQGTTTTVTANPTTAVTGQSVTLTSTVTASNPGQPTPTGQVTFMNGSVELGSAPLVNGVATLTTTKLTAGTALVTAKYGGDDTFNTSTSPGTTVQVTAADTTTTVKVSPNPSRFSQVVTLTATVAPVSPGTGVPTGTVQFKNGGTALGNPVALVNGVATMTTTALANGNNSITAEYQGSTAFKTSNSTAVNAVVRSSNAAVTLTVSKNTTVAFEAVTLTATVTAGAGGTGTPTGTVAFFGNGGQLLGTAEITNGVAKLATSKLIVGTNTIFASYRGDANFNVAQSNSVTVQSGDQDERYLNAVYVDALGRAAQLFELDLWRTQLRLGKTRQSIVNRIVTSPEGQIAQVRALYRQFLRRLPSNPEIIQGTTALRGTSGFQYEASLLGSREYFVSQGGGTNSGFLTALYRDVLGTTVPPETRARQTRALDRGASRTTLALGLVQSQPGKTALVNFLFQQTFRRPATSGEMQYYLGQLNRGRSVQQVFIGILSSDEFFVRFRTTA